MNDAEFQIMRDALRLHCEHLLTDYRRWKRAVNLNCNPELSNLQPARMRAKTSCILRYVRCENLLRKHCQTS